MPAPGNKVFFSLTQVLELTEMLLGSLASAGKPLTAAELERCRGHKAGDHSCAPVIRDLVRAGSLHRWSKQRYWLESEFVVLEREARKLIRTRPLWKSRLSEKLAKTAWGSPRSTLDAVFDRLKKSPGVHRWPRHGSLPGDSLCLKEIDLSFYLGKLRKHYERMARKLTQAGIPAETVAGAVCGTDFRRNPAPAKNGSDKNSRPARGGEAEEDFQRDVCEQLVFAWRESCSEETRRQLEQAMFNSGLRRFGTPGDEVAFDGLAHESAGLLLPGEKAVVEASGWKLDRRGRSRVLIKATVKR